MSNAKPFLMFQGNGEEAINFYISIFEDSEITSLNRRGPEGSNMQATFTIKGQEFMCNDSSIKHGFTFTPSFSIFITCDSENELDELYGKLSEGGAVLMPLGEYGFSKKFAWVNDKYGVSWQLNLPE
ncbi:VOC family protein [Lederbergia wuyishanensis]|uniref:3-demethylubiquinone-9 3-methyltransferase (Glyoxalase superfamily) n=1 Tax=Lederbergia wuyishanensis TaxID=1347903 RepID=A0ABU0D328_9BACI|nr:VOC family protein [Lederbergia wuyishanensis]MCJ8007043.1 VOC family protein [Lederbergia wuyishanensis]MDQ0342813.1 putative 3-demethylubiquinone-9 3-methyltransferase (glyoxalase superfamily) [Lederbergia wuyishanensis]